MTDKAFSELIDRVQPHAPGCPYPTIINAIRQAAIAGCERTLSWRYQIPRFYLVPGVHEYSFTRPTNADVHAVFSATANDDPLSLLNLDTALAQYPAWANLYSGEDASVVWSETPDAGAFNAGVYDDDIYDTNSDFVLPAAIVAEASTPETMVQLTPQQYIILPLPDEGPYLMRMFVALKPTRAATTMASDIMDELEDIIFHKACEDLQLMPNKPWTDPASAQINASKYRYQSWERKARANLGHVRGSLGVRNRSFI